MWHLQVDISTVDILFCLGLEKYDECEQVPASAKVALELIGYGLMWMPIHRSRSPKAETIYHDSNWDCNTLLNTWTTGRKTLA